MLTTWTKVNQKLDRFLDDPNRVSFSEKLRIDAWNWAQRALVHHTPMQKTVTLVIDTDKRSGILPNDLFEIRGLYDSQEEQWWWPMSFKPGDIRYADDDVLEYWTWNSALYLEKELAHSSTHLTLYYWAYYPELEYTESGGAVVMQQESVYTPRWAELALCHLVTATCLMPQEIFASDINEYRSKLEAGDPLDNPRQQSATYHYEWWLKLLDSFPPGMRMVLR